MSPRAAERAAASAASAVSEQNALTTGFTRSMRSRTARVSSTGESAFVLINRASSVAGVKPSSVELIRVLQVESAAPTLT